MKILKSNILIILSLMFIIITIRSFTKYNLLLSDWIFTQFFFNYEYEYVKRGLVGELIRIFYGVPSMEIVISISLISVFLIFLFSIFVFYKIYKDENLKNYWIIIPSIIFCSAMYQHINYDIGRFDTFLILIFFLSLFLIFYLKKEISLLFIIFLQIIGIMTHEIYVLSFSLLTIFIWSYQNKLFLSKYIFVYIFTIFFSTILLFYFGRVSTLEYQEYYNILTNKYSKISLSSFNVLYRTLFDSIINTYITSLSIRRLYDHLSMFFGLIGFFILYFFILFNCFKLKKIKILILFFCCLSPLLIYPFSHDHFRWWHLFFTNFFTLIIFLILKRDEVILHLLDNFFKIKYFKKIYIFSIFLSFVLGPLGSTHSYLILYKLKNFIFKLI